MTITKERAREALDNVPCCCPNPEHRDTVIRYFEQLEAEIEQLKDETFGYEAPP